jgi:hypothetical protein
VPVLNCHEAFIPSLEEEKTDALEMAAKAPQEDEARQEEKGSVGIVLFFYTFCSIILLTSCFG